MVEPYWQLWWRKTNHFSLNLTIMRLLLVPCYLTWPCWYPTLIYCFFVSSSLYSSLVPSSTVGQHALMPWKSSIKWIRGFLQWTCLQSASGMTVHRSSQYPGCELPFLPEKSFVIKTAVWGSGCHLMLWAVGISHDTPIQRKKKSYAVYCYSTQNNS